MLRLSRPFLLVLSASAMSAALFAACSTGDGAQGGTQGGTVGGGGKGGDGATVGGAGGNASGGGGGDGGLTEDSACGVISQDAKVTPLDLYILIDRSSSMEGAPWISAKAGLAAFMADPTSADIRVAINFFPKENVPPSCASSVFVQPAVDFAPISQNAGAIVQAMDATTPSGFSSPVYPALGGALNACITVAQNNPGHAAAALLVTDGEPQGPPGQCGGLDPEDPQVIADLAAKAAAGSGQLPEVRTFVIGLPGTNVSFANAVAVAGKSDAAILITNPNNIELEFQKALAKVRGEALPCEYDLPPSIGDVPVDPGLVNVQVTPGGGGQVATLLQDASCADGKGWYYDDPANPKRILFCGESCQALRADFGAKVLMLFGCATEVAK